MSDEKNYYIGHCTTSNSDKIYIISLIEWDPGVFGVNAYYGRRNGNIKKAIKLKSGSLSQAWRVIGELHKSKFIKGDYVDIDDSDYDGLVTRNSVATYLSDEVTNNGRVPKAKAKAPENKPKSKPKRKDFLVKCVNNLGLEDKFDEGAEYKQVRTMEDDFIEVIDKNGVKQACFSDRFFDKDEVPF